MKLKNNNEEHEANSQSIRIRQCESITSFSRSGRALRAQKAQPFSEGNVT